MRKFLVCLFLILASNCFAVSNVLSILQMIDTNCADETTTIVIPKAAITNVQFAGNVEFVGAGRPTGYVWAGAQALQAAGVKPASLVVRGTGVAFEFVDGQEKQIQFNLKLPSNADFSEPFYINIGWDTIASNKVCDWETEYLVTAWGENVLGTPTSVQTNATSSSSTNAMICQELTSFSANTNDICLHATITRDGNDASDTLSAAAYIEGVAISFTKKEP